MKLEVNQRNDEIGKLRHQLDTSKKLAHAVEVSALLKKDYRKADVSRYHESVSRIGAVSDQLSKLSERLDAMIATG